MSTDLVARPANFDVVQVAEHFVQSGWFKDSKDVSQAVVKILAGQEMGLGPMASMQGVHIIEGKPTMSANLLGAQVKRHPAYNYRVIEQTEDRCSIEFYEHGQKVGDSTFSIADAQKAGVAGKPNWKRYPKAMLFARAMSQGVRTHCPDVTAGPAYVPEELGAQVGETGEPIHVEQPAEQAPVEDAEEVTGEVVTEGPPRCQPDSRVAAVVDGCKRTGWPSPEVLEWLALHVGRQLHSTQRSVSDLVATLTDDQIGLLETEIQRRADEEAPDAA